MKQPTRRAVLAPPTPPRAFCEVLARQHNGLGNQMVRQGSGERDVCRVKGVLISRTQRLRVTVDAARPPDGGEGSRERTCVAWEGLSHVTPPRVTANGLGNQMVRFLGTLHTDYPREMPILSCPRRGGAPCRVLK